MKNHEKLDFLMKLANVTNTRLARAVAFDASYISRIRSGRRNFPKSEAFLKPLSVFFAKNLTEEYRRGVLADLICPKMKWPENAENAETLIRSWLTEDESGTKAQTAAAPYADNRGFTFSKEAPAVCEASSDIKPVFYYGNTGKRAAVKRFLEELCAAGEPAELLLYSNEDMSWMYEESDFTRRWAELMAALIKKGAHIKLIHTVSRGAGEMLTALRMWMPLYLSGAIEPYFYPKLRDRVYKRTLFVAKDRFAVASDSVGIKTENALNIFLSDRNAVAALETEFLNYLKLCSPLMKVFNRQNAEAFIKLFEEFEESEGALITSLPALSVSVMPEETAEALSARCGNGLMAAFVGRIKKRFEDGSGAALPVTDIIRPIDINAVKAGKLKCLPGDMCGCPELCYTPEEFRELIIKTLEKRRESGNYKITLSDGVSEKIIIYAKEDVGAAIISAETPFVALCINEHRVTSAVWEYLTRLSENGKGEKETLKTLENYIEELSE